MSKRNRNFGSGGFGTNSFMETEDADPRIGLVNLADVMLVFACGLMLALIVHWNVSVGVTEVENIDEMTELSDEQIEDMADNMTGSGDSYTEKGIVYEDPKTGRMYLLENVDDK